MSSSWDFAWLSVKEERLCLTMCSSIPRGGHWGDAEILVSELVEAAVSTPKAMEPNPTWLSNVCWVKLEGSRRHGIILCSHNSSSCRWFFHFSKAILWEPSLLRSKSLVANMKDFLGSVGANATTSCRI